jgi:hypothetical protein
MTKEYGTDFLVPAAIRDRLQDKFIFEKSKSARVKGKSAPIEVYKVWGYVDEAGQPVRVETAYSSYASEKSDKAVHDEPAKEATEEPVERTETTGIFDRTGFMEVTNSGAEPATQIHAPTPPALPTAASPEMERLPSVAVMMAAAEVSNAEAPRLATPPALPIPPSFPVPPALPTAGGPAFDGQSTCALFNAVPYDSSERSSLRIQAPPPLPTAPSLDAVVDAWMIQIGGEALGPMTAGELLAGFRSGELAGEWLVSPQGKADTPQALAHWAQSHVDAA